MGSRSASPLPLRQGQTLLGRSWFKDARFQFPGSGLWLAFGIVKRLRGAAHTEELSVSSRSILTALVFIPEATFRSVSTQSRDKVFEMQRRFTELTAITRQVSPSINDCEMSFHARQPIDVAKAMAQHRAYQDCLAELGVRLISLPAEPALPDAVFVEDPAVVVDEVAVISNMGAPSRRPEARSLADALAHYRPLKFLVEPATLDGGDVMRIDRAIFVGLSQRTNREGIAQLSDILRPYGYQVRPVEVRACLHLKSACSYIGNNTILVNRSLFDAEQLSEFELIDVPREEPGAANALLIKDVVIIPASFPETRTLLEGRGFQVKTIDLSELQKAEAGVTCTSSIFNFSGA